MNDKYITVREAAKVLKLSEKTIYAYIKDKKLQGFKLPGRTVVLVEEVEALNEPQPIKD